MPEFLTAEWVAELDARARAATPGPVPAAGRLFTVEFHVSGSPEGEFVYQAAFGDVALRFAPGSPSEPDLVVTLDAAFAARIRRGDANAQDALAAGALKIRGDLDGVAGAAAGIAALGELLAAAFAASPQGPGA